MGSVRHNKLDVLPTNFSEFLNAKNSIGSANNTPNAYVAGASNKNTPPIKSALKKTSSLINTGQAHLTQESSELAQIPEYAPPVKKKQFEILRSSN